MKKIKLITLLITVLLMLFSKICVASDVTNWIGAQGDWFNSNNWDNGTPESGMRAFISNGGEAQIIGGNAQARILALGNLVASPGGTVTQQGGTLDVSERIYVAYNYGSIGTYYLKSDGGIHVGGDEYIGYRCHGNFIHESGINRVDQTLYLGYEYYSGATSGTYTLESGQLYANKELIGRLGYYYQSLHSTGTFNHKGGTNAISTDLTLGERYDSVGMYNLDSGTLYVGGNENLGRQGRGEFTQNGGVHTVQGNMYMGYEYGSWRYVRGEGIYTLNDGDFSVYGNEIVGYSSGRGQFVQSGGEHSISGDILIGTELEIGSYLFSGGELDAHSCIIGSNGVLEVCGNNGTATFDELVSTGSIISEITDQGLSACFIDGLAQLSGTLTVVDNGASLGKYTVLYAGDEGSISGDFSNVILPGSDWTWGMNEKEVWVQHTPEPATLFLLTLGGLLLRKRK